MDLAAAYRLVSRYGWEDLVFTHISARVPGTEDQFLINPYGLFFDEITVRGVYGHDWTSVRRAISHIESHTDDLGILCTHTYGLDGVDEALQTLGGEGAADAIHITVVPG